MKNKKKIKRIDQPDNDTRRPEFPDDGSQGRPTHHTGTTVQGGSDFGQGSHYLGPESYTQGQVKNEGSNYENEAGHLSELHD